MVEDVAPGAVLGSVGQYGWGGAAGTFFWVDPQEELVAVLMVQQMTPEAIPVIADWKTLEDLGIPRDGKFVLSWAFHPRPLPLAVPTAVVTMAARRGMDVTVLRPEGYGLPAQVMETAVQAASFSGGSVRETNDRAEAMEGAHVVYAKSWHAPAAYGDVEAEARLREGLRDWRVAEEWFGVARPDARFMHCLPVRRNVVVADAVLDGARSVVVQQAGNRLHVQKAVLLEMLGGSDT